MKALLAAGAGKEAKAGPDKVTPLQMAHKCGASSCVELLLAAGAVDNRASANLRRGTAELFARFRLPAPEPNQASGSNTNASGIRGGSARGAKSITPCVRCGTTAVATHKCAGCLGPHYCGRECQKADWKAGHKAVCKAAAVNDD